MNKDKTHRKYRCALCAIVFKEFKQLKEHINCHLLEVCLCSVSSLQAGNLESNSYIHSGQKPFKCIQYSAVLSKPGDQGSHSSIHSKEKPFKCNQCSASFSHQANMKLNMEIHKGGFVETKEKP